MHHPPYETRALVKLHQGDLLKKADQDRLLHLVPRTTRLSIRCILAAAGRWLVVIGTQLENRYADAPLSVSLAIAREGNT